MQFEPGPSVGWPPVERHRVATKDDWRRRAKAARPGGIIAPDASIQQELVDFVAGAVPIGSWVVGYEALEGEYDVSAVLTHLDSMGRPAALVRTPDQGHDLTIHPFGSDREVHRFGFSQPVIGASQVPIDSVGAVLVPCLALDLNGTRLGFGAGYFDRFLARIITGVPLIGLTTLAPIDRLPREGHDVPMTHVGADFGSGFKVQSIASAD